jgi:hypothetical protein
VEIAAGAAVVAGPRVWVRAGALASGGLMTVFTIAVLSAVVRGINISCGCFGSGSGPITWVTVLRDVALLAACAGVFVLAQEAPNDGAASGPKPRAPSEPPRRAPEPAPLG